MSESASLADTGAQAGTSVSFGVADGLPDPSIARWSGMGALFIVDSSVVLAPTFCESRCAPTARGCVRKSGVRRAGVDDPSGVKARRGCEFAPLDAAPQGRPRRVARPWRSPTAPTPDDPPGSFGPVPHGSSRKLTVYNT
jgi:hypothetical protein